MKWMRCGRLKRGSLVAACSMISFDSASPALWPGRSATYAAAMVAPFSSASGDHGRFEHRRVRGHRVLDFAG